MAELLEMYANSRFKAKVNEWGRVEKWIEPGDKISQSDLGVDDAEWEYLVSSGAVVNDYPEGLDPGTPPAEYYRDNPDEAPKLDVDASTPSEEASPKIETAPAPQTQLPKGDEKK